MNILFFLTPKSELSYLFDDNTVRQALEKLEVRRHVALPLIKRTGEYIGTISEGDLLSVIKNTEDFSMAKASEIRLSAVPRYYDIKAVRATTDIESLIERALNQNFIPVIDDRGILIGIVTRKRIIDFLKGKVRQNTDETKAAAITLRGR